MLIPIGVLRYEIEVEQGVVVYELVCRLLGLLADGSKLADEPALLQFLQRFRKFSIVCEFRRFQQLFPEQPLLLPGKRGDDGNVAAWFLEQRSIEGVKLLCEFSAWLEEYAVEILRHAHSLFQETPIVWDSSQSHVGFEDLPVLVAQALCFAILLTLSEGEWLQQHLAGKAVVKPAVVHDHIVCR